MSTRTARVLSLFGLLVAVTATTTGCAGTATSDLAATNDAFTTTKALSDDQLAAAFARAPAEITAAQAHTLFAETLYPVATTKRLAMLNAFIGQRNDGKFDVYGNMAFQMEALILTAPNDLASAPAAFGGQTFTTAVVSDETSLGPIDFTVHGTATSDYTLSFKMGGIPLTAKIPTGSTATQTAKRIADAMTARAEDIAGSMGAAFEGIGADSSESPSGVDDVEITPSGATLGLVAALNG